MKQLRNLAIICAKRKNTLCQILDGRVCVFVGEGPNRASMEANCDDDEALTNIIHELNYGRYSTKTEERNYEYKRKCA